MSPQGPDPGDRLLALVGKPGGPLEDASLWSLEVVASSDITPTMRRVELHSPGLAELRYRAGQDLMLRVPTDAGAVTNRRYTIRDLDREREIVTCDILLHGQRTGIGVGRGGAADGSDRRDRSPREDLGGGGRHALVLRRRIGRARNPRDDRRPPGRCVGARDAQRRLVERRATVPARTACSGRSCGGCEARQGSTVSPCRPAVFRRTSTARRTTSASSARALVDLGLRSDQIVTKSYWSRGRANAEHGEPVREEA